jgi:membrane protein DedA with SNARE-associated domain
VSSHEITHLIHDFGLIVVFVAVALQAVGFPIPGGTVLAAAAVDASTKRGLPVAGVIMAGAFGALAGTTIGFALGRWRGEAILVRLGRLLRRRPQRVQELRDQFRRHAVVPIIVARFVTGARNVVGLLAGASGMPLRRFLPASALAATAWSAIITLEYYVAGRTLLGAPWWVQVGLIIVGVVATVISLRLLRPSVASGAGTRAPAGDACE